MSQKEIIAPCKLCRDVTEVRPLGEGDPPALLCLPCANRVNPASVREMYERAVQTFADSMGDFLDPKNPTSTSVH